MTDELTSYVNHYKKTIIILTTDIQKLAVSILHYLQRFNKYVTNIEFINVYDNKMKIGKVVSKNTNF